MGHDHEGAFVAFYSDPALARASEPEVAGNARALGGEAERRGAVTVVWLERARGGLRPPLRACGLA